MQVKLLTDLRGPKGAYREVFAKIRSSGDSLWYIIYSMGGYDTDSSEIEHDDTFLYIHPDVEGTHGFRMGDKVQVGQYTWIPGDAVMEVVKIKNNTEAKGLLSKEW
jgi:hypothetical protein